MKLFHLLSFTKELFLPSQLLLLDLTCFLCVFYIALRFLRNQQEQPVTLLKHLVEAAFCFVFFLSPYKIFFGVPEFAHLLRLF